MLESLSERVASSRFTVVAVDPDRGQVRLRGEAGACADLACAADTVVVTDDGNAPLGALNPGDVVRVEGPPGPARRVVVLRTVFDELTSPEV